MLKRQFGTQGTAGDEGEVLKGGRKTQDERRATAFRAFLEILETADWIEQELRPQMQMFGVSIDGLRFLEMLHSSGRVTIREAAEKRHCTKQSVANLVETLRERGWVEYEVERVVPGDDPEDGARRTRRTGWRVAYIRLSDEGKRFVRSVLPRNMKLVLAFMRALEWREQTTLIETCRKLRDGNILRFLREMEFQDVED
ncbi:MAG TPA: MarR family transcriptional regulator [Candidatus Acidoferrales bacterium]